MDKISSITIVLNGIATTYHVGQGDINGKRIIASIERVRRYEDSTGECFPGNFLAKDKDGNKLVEISDTIPYVITYV